MAKKEKDNNLAEEAQLTKTTFKGKVNKYCFIHLKKPVMEAWGIKKGVEQPITIEITAEGNLRIRKA